MANHPKTVPFALLCLAVAGAARAQHLPAAIESGIIEYPARGNIQLDEGTIDLWVISSFDTDVKEPNAAGEDRRAATLVDIIFPDEKWHYVLYFIAWGNSFAMVGYNHPGQPYVWMGPTHWKPGEAHHVVITWSGRKRSVYVDGNCTWMGTKGPNVARDVDVGGPIAGDLTSAIIRCQGIFILDEMQIRNVALTEKEIVAAKDAPLTADAHTLLLDHCDGGPPEIISGASGEIGGTLSGGHEIVEGKFGKAIKLWKEKP